MSWGKLDDQFWRNRKVRRLARRRLRAVGFLALAISYASEHETDGLLTESDLEEIMPWRPFLRRRLVNVLVESGSLERGRGRYRSEWRRGEEDLEPGLGYHDLPDGTYLLHDYLDHNKSNALREIERRGNKERQKRRRGSAPPGEAQAA